MMNKRVYGVLGISSIMANWNADFSGYPKTTSDGRTFGSDKAFKYPMKKMWENEGEKVLYIKSMRFLKDEKKGTVQLIPRTLKERYDYIFNEGKESEIKDSTVVLKNLFSAIDVKNFGATFAEAGNNISITGAVQIGQGFNEYEDSEAHEQSILSPFRDPTAKEKSKKGQDVEGEDAKNSTLGTKIVSDEAHYFYPFSINPMAYKEFVELEVTDGYTEDDYQLFKKASLSAATSFATNAKSGCENEFALYVETENDTYLPNLTKYMEFSKGEEGKKNKIQITCGEALNTLKDRILSIEIYYNTHTTEIITPVVLEGAKYFDILTQKEV